MPKATAVWLVDNTTLTFDQIAIFTGLHALEIAGIADGEVAVGMKGFDPVANAQLTRDEIARCENDSTQKLELMKRVQAPEPKKKSPRYTPLSKRLERPAAITWLVRNHPELADSQICKLLGTTKATIQAIRDKSHWNSMNIQPVDPVALGFCRQIDLDAAVNQAAKRRTAEMDAQIHRENESLLTTEESLKPVIKGFEGIESFQLDGAGESASGSDEKDSDLNPDALFNLPSGTDSDEEKP